ncbi:acyl-CoA dehydrogenase [Varunaivibrio sulfuroxidans]|uniref:Acyl-coenzyme A dehydrogenase n=1 Tax=Varunaivibrio sulfuroxidans TaxID=1773489 RepID=A0A4R3J7W2_9PROT|nr:acyl-CoA dehydrogenase [Varunaivibrio sulfuroxidans]TCS60996.1 acyl-CoA dehydrogenase [Varunaivibrio sulfuroxidans]WES31598.1 acyl-CoA dehydrogenase [Varunaivibrio sulfuroxidans]
MTWIVIVIVIALIVVFGVSSFRISLISAPLMRLVGRMLPAIGETERIALEAGTVWWDGDLFSGKPDWKKLLAFTSQGLSAEEQAYLDGPVEEFCRALDDWLIAQDRDLPPEAWALIKKHRLFGMIIPKEYGGHGFSAIAHSAVVTKIASVSSAAAVTVMVPNSLGPGELLVHYGTQAQKDKYLKKLASGDDIPCFALTEPGAGSDAANGASRGVVAKGRYGGKQVLGLRLDFDKRYITLAPVATVIGLAFRAYDPDGLLGDVEDLGITCALLPRKLKGLEIGDHHDPMGVPFHNGPVRGKGVFIPLEFVIGEREGVGQGWRMLMESLAAGRSISLPALSVGAVELAARVAGAYGVVREQFGLPIGRFEGVQEALARIGGYAYFMNAARRLTAGAVDAGEKPAVISAIVKAYLTAGMRDRVNDAMDIRGGAEICRGPRNILGRGYLGVPVAITVEGANILTRSLIVFGQGAMRCHPYVQDEIQAIAAKDMEAFDRAFFGHILHIFKNAGRAFGHAVSGAMFADSPVMGPEAKYYRRLTRLSAGFAFATDVALMSLGGALKRKESFSGRMADVLAWMYMASAALKQFHDDGRPPSQLPHLRWACEHALFQSEQALLAAVRNFPLWWARVLLRVVIFPLGGRYAPVNDALSRTVAGSLTDGSSVREKLSPDIHIPEAEKNGLGRLEATLDKILATDATRKKIQAAVRGKTLKRGPIEDMIDQAKAADLIDDDEAQKLKDAEEARWEVIQVDVFSPDTYKGLKG